MKKLNNKGFTLVELLVVIVILVVIMSIAIPSITSSIERSKDKQRKLKISLIESAAELYVDSHKNSFSNCSTSICNITVKTLVDDGKITKEEIEDPSNSSSTICGFVKYNGSSYVFEESSVNQAEYCVKLSE